MRDILSKLNRIQGVRGSMVVSRDGIVIASDFSEDIGEEQLGAISSSLLAALDGALKRFNFGKFSRFIISGSGNKLALVDAGNAMLLVLMSRDMNLGMVNLEIKQAVGEIIEKSKM